jgi:hypothetical protein
VAPVALVSLFALFVAGLVVGCSSSGPAPESKKAVEGFQKTRTAIADAQAKVDRTNAALDQLAAGGDLQKSFKNYTSSVNDLEKTAQDARQRAERMRERVKEYESQWQTEIDAMEDPTIRAGSAERREAVRQNFQKVRDSAQAAREAYEPYMAQLQEIQRAMAIDLTPQNVSVMRPAFDKARQQGQTLKQRLSAMRADLDNITRGTSPTGTAR